MFEHARSFVSDALSAATASAASSEFYSQIAAALAAAILARLLASLLSRRLPSPGEFAVASRVGAVRRGLYRARALLFPALAVLLLGVAAEVLFADLQHSWLVRLAQSIAMVFLLYVIVEQFVRSQWIVTMFKWVGIPIATLHIFGGLDDVANYLDTLSLEVGNIRVSALALSRTIIFGSLLFWLGRMSNAAGKEVIRSQQALDAGTREVFVKLFEIALYVIVFLLLLQVMGINLTALAVFGGALGVGLGFGLQQIASNFISGIIILLDRSLSIGDYIEFEDGNAGRLSDLNMRYAVLEAFDGKELMVPNEKFITTSFVNWTHKNHKQRYSLNFSVAYKTDLDQLFELVREVVARHPQVISGPDIPIEERPDAEISAFGDSGIDILVEFWMEGIDDGPNRVRADLLLDIWRALRDHGIEIPFPQREVRVLNPERP